MTAIVADFIRGRSRGPGPRLREPPAGLKRAAAGSASDAKEGRRHTKVGKLCVQCAPAISFYRAAMSRCRVDSVLLDGTDKSAHSESGFL